MTTINIPRWDGKEAYETEATANDGRWLSLFTAPIPACPWGRWIWTVDTFENADEPKLRPIALGIAYNLQTAMTEAEAAAGYWLQPKPRLEAVD